MTVNRYGKMKQGDLMAVNPLDAVVSMALAVERCSAPMRASVKLTARILGDQFPDVLTVNLISDYSRFQYRRQRSIGPWAEGLRGEDF